MAYSQHWHALLARLSGFLRLCVVVFIVGHHVLHLLMKRAIPGTVVAVQVPAGSTGRTPAQAFAGPDASTVCHVWLRLDVAQIAQESCASGSQVFHWSHPTCSTLQTATKADAVGVVLGFKAKAHYKRHIAVVSEDNPKFVV